MLAQAPAQLDSFTYEDAIVRKSPLVTFIWGLVGMSVGLLIALQPLRHECENVRVLSQD